MNIVFASHTEIGSTFVVGSHHLARELARSGHKVLHLSSPVSPAHLWRIGDPGMRKRFAIWGSGGAVDADGVINYVGMSVLPWRAALRLGAGGAQLYAHMLPPLQRVLKKHGIWPVDALFVDQPQLAGVETQIDPKVLIYRATDLYRAMTGSDAVANAERRLARKADLIVGTSAPVLQHLRGLTPLTPSLLLENGVEFDHFSTPLPMPPEYADIPAPRAVYAGALDERFDAQQIRALAGLPGSIVLIGPPTATARDTLRDCKNVHLLGARPYRVLPAYLQHAQIGLLPLGTHPANQGRSPMKLFEYGAAGLPVVATATQELLRRALPFVRLADSSEAFAAQVEALMNEVQSRSALAQIARSSARQYGWADRAQQLIDATMRCRSRIAPSLV